MRCRWLSEKYFAVFITHELFVTSTKIQEVRLAAAEKTSQKLVNTLVNYAMHWKYSKKSSENEERRELDLISSLCIRRVQRTFEYLRSGIHI